METLFREVFILHFSKINLSSSVFQDVHVMIFLGFGFLMTFLKKYGLSAVSLNLMCSALAIEVFTLVFGFFHLQCETPNVRRCSETVVTLLFRLILVPQTAQAVGLISMLMLGP
jgi:hypothetical protein